MRISAIGMACLLAALGITGVGCASDAQVYVPPRRTAGEPLLEIVALSRNTELGKNDDVYINWENELNKLNRLIEEAVEQDSDLPLPSYAGQDSGHPEE